jgi:hypothetical protein
MKAAGGPPVGSPDRGGHTIEPTPPGFYTLGARVHVVTTSWPKSVIPYDAALRINAGGEVEYEASPKNWKVATGPNGDVTKAKMAFMRRDKLTPDLATVIVQVRAFFIDPATGNLKDTTWLKNDFGRWGWNLLSRGHATAYFIHTTPGDEQTTREGKDVFLDNSHGCIHLVPAERDRLEKAGYLKRGVSFEVRPYTEAGPPK